MYDNPYYKPYWVKDDELEHYGVKGMRWGKHLKSALNIQDRSSRSKQSSREREIENQLRGYGSGRTGGLNRQIQNDSTAGIASRQRVNFNGTPYRSSASKALNIQNNSRRADLSNQTKSRSSLEKALNVQNNSRRVDLSTKTKSKSSLEKALNVQNRPITSSKSTPRAKAVENQLQGRGTGRVGELNRQIQEDAAAGITSRQQVNFDGTPYRSPIDKLFNIQDTSRQSKPDKAAQKLNAQIQADAAYKKAISSGKTAVDSMWNRNSMTPVKQTYNLPLTKKGKKVIKKIEKTFRQAVSKILPKKKKN